MERRWQTRSFQTRRLRLHGAAGETVERLQCKGELAVMCGGENFGQSREPRKVGRHMRQTRLKIPGLTSYTPIIIG